MLVWTILSAIVKPKLFCNCWDHEIGTNINECSDNWKQISVQDEDQCLNNQGLTFGAP